MEPAGVALGAVVLVKPVITTVANIIQSERRFGTDSGSLQVRFEAQKNRLESLERVLFELRWLKDQEKVSVWSLLPDTIQSDVVGMLHQLYVLLSDFVAVKARYDLHPEPSTANSAVDSLVSSEGISTSETREQLVALGNARAKKKRHSTRWVTRMWWATYEKKTVVSLVEEFEDWNRRLKEAIESVWWPLPFLTSVSALEDIAKDSDISATKLMEDVQVRKLLITTTQPDNEVISSLGAEKDDFRRISQLDGFEVGVAKLEGKQWPVMVEYKQYGQTKNGSIDKIDLRRIQQLAVLLNQQDDSRFRVFRCIALFNQGSQARYGFIFAIPPELKPAPTTLKEQLINTAKGPRAALEMRVRLAHALSESLLLLHSVGWIHQSFRCDNILLFPPKDLTITGPLSSGVVVDRYVPQICGFEFSRSVDAYSYQHSGIEPWKNLYRHPDRWGQPVESYGRQHDIYGLGVVLLEIGLWERVDIIDRGRLLVDAERFRDMERDMTGTPMAKDEIKTSVRKRLLRHVNERLGFYMGTQYQTVVRKCLDNTFRDMEHIDYQAAVSKDVVRMLEGLLDVAGSSTSDGE